MARVRRDCRRSERLFLAALAASQEQRSIPLVVVTAQPEHTAQTIRVLVLGGQHGDEPAPTEALLDLLNQWAQDGEKDRRLLQRVTLLVLPLVNPDGAVRNQRENAAGVDLNRDWMALSQPETRFVEAIVQRWQPHLVCDLHSFDRDDPASEWYGSDDLIEIYLPARETQAALAQTLKTWQAYLGQALRQRGWRVRAALSLSKGSEPEREPETLAHRHFCRDHGRVAFLFEAAERKAAKAQSTEQRAESPERRAQSQSEQGAGSPDSVRRALCAVHDRPAPYCCFMEALLHRLQSVAPGDEASLAGVRMPAAWRPPLLIDGAQAGAERVWEYGSMGVWEWESSPLRHANTLHSDTPSSAGAEGNRMIETSAWSAGARPLQLGLGFILLYAYLLFVLFQRPRRR